MWISLIPSCSSVHPPSRSNMYIASTEISKQTSGMSYYGHCCCTCHLIRCRCSPCQELFEERWYHRMGEGPPHRFRCWGHYVCIVPHTQPWGWPRCNICTGASSTLKSYTSVLTHGYSMRCSSTNMLTSPNVDLNIRWRHSTASYSTFMLSSSMEHVLVLGARTAQSYF